MFLMTGSHPNPPPLRRDKKAKNESGLGVNRAIFTFSQNRLTHKKNIEMGREKDIGKAKRQQRKNDEADARRAVADAIDREIEDVEANVRLAFGELDKDTKRMVENQITSMRRIMMGEGLYTKEQTFQVRATAQTYILLKRIFAEAMKVSPLITEKSREADNRVKVAPIYQLYIQFDNLFRHDLRALRLNAEAKAKTEEKGDEDDALLNLIKKQREEDEEED